jgi:hypothetical protein
MLSVTDPIQIVQQILYQGSSRRVWRLQNRRNLIRTVKYADDLVLLAREETVLQGMIDSFHSVVCLTNSSKASSPLSSI